MDKIATLQFNLEKTESQKAFKRCVKALDLATAIRQITELPEHFETTRNLDLKQLDMNTRYQIKIENILKQNSIDLNELLNK